MTSARSHPFPAVGPRRAAPLRAVLAGAARTALVLASVLLTVLLTVLFSGLLMLLPGAGEARAEYRAYELEIIDLYDCRLNKREQCRTGQVTTGLDPNQYLLTHGGSFHIGVLLLATWMCHGDTSFYKPVCPRPVTRSPRFNAGDAVEIALEKHITEGWRGKVEVAYYQHSVRSNVYGVRFPDRRNVYARYFEKDLKKADAAAQGPAPGQAPGTAAAGTGPVSGSGTAATAGPQPAGTIATLTATATAAAQPQAAPPP